MIMIINIFVKPLRGVTICLFHIYYTSSSVLWLQAERKGFVNLDEDDEGLDEDGGDDDDLDGCHFNVDNVFSEQIFFCFCNASL